MAGLVVVPPPPPPGGPQPTQKTSDIIGTFRPTKLFKLARPEISVTSLDFDDSGEFLLAACDDESLQLYNAKEGKLIKSLFSKKYGAHLARFTHHSQSIIYASTKATPRPSPPSPSAPPATPSSPAPSTTPSASGRSRPPPPKAGSTSRPRTSRPTTPRRP
ncbi:MAG: hypothetical protein LQ347_006940 [Umbilicaria vellea]|nr:MAG: hypothetical protein LQ347_006940 [Umbilicaria vellea]